MKEVLVKMQLLPIGNQQNSMCQGPTKTLCSDTPEDPLPMTVKCHEYIGQHPIDSKLIYRSQAEMQWQPWLPVVIDRTFYALHRKRFKSTAVAVEYIK